MIEKKARNKLRLEIKSEVKTEGTRSLGFVNDKTYSTAPGKVMIDIQDSEQDKFKSAKPVVSSQPVETGNVKRDKLIRRLDFHIESSNSPNLISIPPVRTDKLTESNQKSHKKQKRQRVLCSEVMAQTPNSAISI